MSTPLSVYSLSRNRRHRRTNLTNQLFQRYSLQCGHLGSGWPFTIDPKCNQCSVNTALTHFIVLSMVNGVFMGVLVLFLRSYCLFGTRYPPAFMGVVVKVSSFGQFFALVRTRHFPGVRWVYLCLAAFLFQDWQSSEFDDLSSRSGCN